MVTATTTTLPAALSIGAATTSTFLFEKKAAGHLTADIAYHSLVIILFAQQGNR